MDTGLAIEKRMVHTNNELAIKCHIQGVYILYIVYI